MNRRHRPPLLEPAVLACVLAALALAAAEARAQTPPDAGRLLEESRANRPLLPPQAPPKVIEAPVRPTVALPEGVSVAVSEFRITGASAYPAELLAELVKPWVGKRLDINGLNEAAGAITRYYQNGGHLLTYAYLPAQKVADGAIEIAVLEGRLEGVQIVTAEDVRLRDEVIQAHTEKLAETTPVLQPAIERQMLLLNDIPGVTARAAFTPGASTGGAEMVVSVAEGEPLEMRAQLDNHGSRSTGEYRAGLNLQFNDLSGWGDHSSARLMYSNKGGLINGSLRSQVPVGGSGLKLGASLSRLDYELGGSFKSLGAVGSANTLGLEASYPVLRSPDANLNIGASYEYKRLSDEIQLIGNSNPKRNGVFELSASGDLRDAWGASAASLTLSSGNLRLLDGARRAQDAAGLQTGRSYRKLSGSLARQQPIAGPFSASLRLSGQASGGNLDSSEKFALAGPNGVRAYAPGEAQVDQGALASAELRYLQEYTGGNLLWSLFHDHGSGLVSRRPLVLAGNEPTLQGSGLGLQWSGGDYSLDATLAWRGSRLPTAEGGDRKPRLYFQFSMTP